MNYYFILSYQNEYSSKNLSNQYIWWVGCQWISYLANWSLVISYPCLSVANLPWLSTPSPASATPFCGGVSLPLQISWQPSSVIPVNHLQPRRLSLPLFFRLILFHLASISLSSSDLALHPSSLRPFPRRFPLCQSKGHLGGIMHHWSVVLDPTRTPADFPHTSALHIWYSVEFSTLGMVPLPAQWHEPETKGHSVSPSPSVSTFNAPLVFPYIGQSYSHPPFPRPPFQATLPSSLAQTTAIAHYRPYGVRIPFLPLKS